MKILVGRAPAPALRMLVAFAFLAQAGSGALAAQSDESHAKMFSLEQKVKIAQFVTKRTRPLANVGFPVAVEGTVPSYIEVQAFPPDVQAVTARLDELGYIIVDELIAIVDQHSRKIVSVFPKWGDLRHLIQ
jgi:hypothetical protein